MTLYTLTLSTPFGLFSAAVDDTGSVVATAFGGAEALRRRIATVEPIVFVADDTRTRHVRTQVRAYCRGEQPDFDLPLNPIGTPFQKRVWTALRSIPPGETRSYADLAMTLRTSPRAVGRANALNPICLIVPCHRVIGKDGGLTGFAFGIGLKRRLLNHERNRASVEVGSRGGRERF